MNEPSNSKPIDELCDAALERVRVREVTGVFHSPDALEETVETLLLSGFDRAEIDRLASVDEARKKLGNVYVAPEELADVARAPRRPFFTRDDITVTVVLVASIFASAGGLVGALAIVASGDESMSAIVAGALAGAACGGAGTILVARLLATDRRSGLENLAVHGAILWIRPRSPDLEKKALRILQEHGARAIRVHEIEIEKRPEDIPLSSLRPDPWLGDERLGQP